MADNITLNSGSGGSVVKTDDDGTAHWQYVKLAYGADNTQTRVTTAAPLPVDLRTDNLAGNLDVNLAADAVGLATSANQLPDGHNVTVDNAAGAAAVNIQDGGNTITVDNGGTFATQVNGDALTALQLIDDVVFVDDTATHAATTTKVAGIGVVAVPTDTTVDANDIAMPGMSTDRRLWVDAQLVGQDADINISLAGEAVVLGAGSASIGVLGANSGVDIGDVTINNTTVAVAGAAADGAALSGNPVLIAGGDTTNAQTLSVDTSGRILNCIPTTPADGESNLQGELIANNSGGTRRLAVAPYVYNGSTWDRLRGTTNGLQVIGSAAHNATAAGAPALAGAQMETMADSAPGTRADTDGDANTLATTDGALYVAGRGPQSWSYHLNTSTAQTDTSVHALPGSNLSLYVTDIVFSHDGTAAINLFFEEATTTVLGPFYLSAQAGGLAMHFQTPKKITANTALTLTTSASHAHSVEVLGFTAPG